MNKFDNIEHMTLQERTEVYTRRRCAEMRGEQEPPRLDDCTKRYISRRLAQLRGEPTAEEVVREHPYIKRRLAELRKKSR